MRQNASHSSRTVWEIDWDRDQARQGSDSKTPASNVDTPDIELTLPARAENIAIVRHACGALGETLGLSDQTMSDISLAVTEACTNVVVHAYDGGEGPLDLVAFVAGPELTILVRDRGGGISPRPDSPGLGLGLPLIASLTETVELGRDHGQETEVRMTFSLTGDPPEPAR